MPSPTPFASGYHPVRRASAVDFLVDGEEAFAAIASAIESAQRSVWATVAFGSLNFRFRPPAQEQLQDLCARTAKRGVKVALLFWQSSAAQDHRDDKNGTITQYFQKELLAKAPGVLVRWDASANQYGGAFPGLGCHHQKSFVIDDSIAFVGGLNLLQEYWDTRAHLADDERRVSYDVIADRAGHARDLGSLPLHDVVCRFNGPAVADVAGNFAERWNGATYKTKGTQDLSLPLPGKDPDSPTRIQIVRTIAPGQYPRTSGGDYSIKEAMLRMINGAARSIYFENQYFFHDDVVQALRSAAQRGVVVVGLLTRRPDAGQVSGFAADVLGQRSQQKLLIEKINVAKLPNLGLYCPFTRGSAGLKDIYVHSKTMIADDRYVLLGSANIATTSLEHHSELDVLVDDAPRALALRKRLWAEHLHLPAVPGSFAEGAALWKAHAWDNLDRAKKKQQLRSRVLPLRQVIGGTEMSGESLDQRLVDDPMVSPLDSDPSKRDWD